MIPQKVQEYLEEYIIQEVYVQIAVIKGKEKISTKAAINRYFSSNHFQELSSGRPYDHFIEGLKDKCLGKLTNSPMRNKSTDDEVIIELQKNLNGISPEKLNDTFWEIETGEFLNSFQIKELEDEKEALIEKLNIEKDTNKSDQAFDTILNFCKKYEELYTKKYPDAPLPLGILD
jgi:hypothetical protein